MYVFCFVFYLIPPSILTHTHRFFVNPGGASGVVLQVTATLNGAAQVLYARTSGNHTHAVYAQKQALKNIHALSSSPSHARSLV